MRESTWTMLAAFFFVAILVFALSGCSMGGHYVPSGPHPHVVYSAAMHIGPTELLHAAVSNAKPVTDLTALTVNLGPTFGHFQPTLGLGWQLSRDWGACNSTGYECTHTWNNGGVIAAGVTYRLQHLRADVRVLQYDNSAVKRGLVFMLGAGP